ncbi:MAG TPA: diphthine--ammonia ligase [Planctomycetota bacterium]|nr:diphthine--ammonia ligase [Planctomycetota bacterium]
MEHETSTSPALISSSGGKDSCLALHRARRAGLDVRVMLSMFDPERDGNRSHGVPLALLSAQADALGLELITPRASWTDYEESFVAQLAALRARGFRTAVFGDIDLQAHRDWEEKVCARAGLAAVLPLWQESRAALVQEVLAAGFRALVVCTDSRFLGDEFCGRPFDAAFVASLPPGVDACGENGEFHTFVHDGPGFRRPVPVELLAREPVVTPAETGARRYCFARLGCSRAS